jgi:hypothetical protein
LPPVVEFTGTTAATMAPRGPVRDQPAAPLGLGVEPGAQIPNRFFVDFDESAVTVTLARPVTASQTSQSLGDMTMHNGITNGHPWSTNQNSFGGINTYSGMKLSGTAVFLYLYTVRLQLSGVF